jgi:hypothetical protein
MKLPNRSNSHLMETKSARLLQSLAPDNWIIRDVTERDYGIDLYIELANIKGEITGDLFSIQLKSKEKLDWKAGEGDKLLSRSPSINVATVNYWFGLPVPVFLFVADLSTKEIFVAPVKQQLRHRFNELQVQDTVSFSLDKRICLNTELGEAVIVGLYLQERSYERFAINLTSLLSNIERHTDFIMYNQGRDFFLPVDSARHLEFRAFHAACSNVSYFVGLDWKLPTLADIYKNDVDAFGDGYPLHEGSLSNFLCEIEKIYPDILERSHDIVTNIQRDYWKAIDWLFYILCDDGDLIWEIRQVRRRLLKEAGAGTHLGGNANEHT